MLSLAIIKASWKIRNAIADHLQEFNTAKYCFQTKKLLKYMYCGNGFACIVYLLSSSRVSPVQAFIFSLILEIYA